MRLRAATVADADALAALHVRSWRDAYRGMLGDDYLDAAIDDERRAFWRDALARPAPRQHVIVAEDGGAIAGFVLAYGRDDPDWGSRIEALHVAREASRRGTGARLMGAAAAWFRATHPGEGIYLWVLEPNAPAQRFYERLGGRNAGRGTWDALDGGRVPKFRYAWPHADALVAGVASALGRSPPAAPAPSPSRPRHAPWPSPTTESER